MLSNNKTKHTLLTEFMAFRKEIIYRKQPN